MTDSHSDDPDGCNHCVAGTKLWLVWDRREGQRQGLEDCEYDDVYTQASFGLRAFLSLASARWFTVSQGRTLFLPGHLTHKVITLKKYLGISSFYVSLPNALSSVSRWVTAGAIMVTEPLRNEIIKLVVSRLTGVAAGDRRAKTLWGFYYLKEALQRWERAYSPAQQRRLRSDPAFRELVDRISWHCR